MRLYWFNLGAFASYIASGNTDMTAIKMHIQFEHCYVTCLFYVSFVAGMNHQFSPYPTPLIHDRSHNDRRYDGSECILLIGNDNYIHHCRCSCGIMLQDNDAELCQLGAIYCLSE